MKKIETIDFYGESDALEGKLLEPGEKLKVLFPDGSTQKVKIKVLREGRSEQVDMNSHPDYFTTNTAFTEIDYHGKKAKVFLRGMFAERCE